MALNISSNYPAANTAATITLAAPTSGNRRINQIAWSYDGDPTGGRLSITDGGSTVFDLDITKGGPGYLPHPIQITDGAAMVITLAAGGDGITGKLNVWI